MFEFTKDELQNWRSQFGSSNSENMGLRYMPMVFTEQGVAMLSSVLKNERAIAVNIKIIRIFTKMRTLLSDNLTLRLEVENIKRKYLIILKIKNWFLYINCHSCESRNLIVEEL